MNLLIKEFGEMLISRPAGREAFLQAKAYLLNPAHVDEEIIFDFKDVKVLAPSWADEFVTQVIALYQDNSYRFLNTENPSVMASLETIGVLPLKK